MLTSFFGKSSPINFLLLGIFIAVFCVLKVILGDGFTLQWQAILSQIGIVVLLVFSMLLLDFIVRKNYLNTSNTFAIFIFSCVVVVLPVMQHLGMMIAQFFLLMALRRIFSMTSEKNIEKKILDASLWILLASYFYFWSILMFILLYIAILKLPQKPFRYLLIPPVGLFGMLLLATAFFLMTDNSFAWLSNYAKPISFHFTMYSLAEVWVFLTFFFSVLIWTLFFRISKLSDVPKKLRNNYLLVIFSVVVSVFIVLFSEIKIVTELIFLAAPSAIVIAGYLEKNDDFWFKELLSWVFLLLPIVFLFV